jgi:kinesin family protein 3/17
MSDAKERIVEKIVEREVIKEINVGVSEEQLEEIHRKAEAEKKLLLDQAKNDLQELLRDQQRTAQEREELEQLLAQEEQMKKKVEAERQAMEVRLKQMEEKLVRGGEVMSKAAKQEAMLRKAQQELEDRRQQELRLAQELAEKEEANLHLEENFSSLQEEVEVKTKKLKKLWQKYQTAMKEVTDLQQEFQQERTDMLEAIRQMTRQLKLKEVVINNFVPEEECKRIEGRARWNDEEDNWVVSHVELAGNRVRVSRPISSAALKRPESEYARQRKQFDNNPRYRSENIVNLDLDMPERTTQEYEGPGTASRVQQVLQMNMLADDSDDVTFASDGIGNPYLHYTAEETQPKQPSRDEVKKDRPRSGKKSSSGGGSDNASSSSSSKRRPRP